MTFYGRLYAGGQRVAGSEMRIRLHYTNGDATYYSIPPKITDSNGQANGTLLMENTLSSSPTLNKWDLIFSYAGKWYYWTVPWVGYTCAPESPEPISTDFYSLDGRAIIVADDGKYLGRVTSNKYDPESIINDYGSYGSPYSTTSIRNQYGTYGSPYSSQSAFNEYASTPPGVYVSGGFVAYLTVNQYKQPRIDPRVLIAWLQSRN